MLTTLVKSLNPASVMKYFMRASCLDMYVVASLRRTSTAARGLLQPLGGRRDRTVARRAAGPTVMVANVRISGCHPPFPLVQGDTCSTAMLGSHTLLCLYATCCRVTDLNLASVHATHPPGALLRRQRQSSGTIIVVQYTGILHASCQAASIASELVCLARPTS